MAEETTSAVGSETSPGEEAVRDRLASVQDALDQIENQVQQDAESLERLRDVLDVSYLEEIARMVNELELRINDVAEEARQARDRAEEAEAELIAEQERLEKLWDVYKQQETELEEAAETRQRAEREAEEAKARVRELEDELESERRALRQAQQENGRLREQLADREAQLEDLASYEDLEDEVQTLETELDDERERLAKLYGVFEETEAERDDLAAELRQWRAWFDAHQSALQGVVEAVNEAPTPEDA